jgi:hypothetical protein
MYSIHGQPMGKARGSKPTHRNVVLKISTYDRLEKFLVELVKAKETPRVSFDDAINELLDRAEKE